MVGGGGASGRLFGVAPVPGVVCSHAMRLFNHCLRDHMLKISSLILPRTSRGIMFHVFHSSSVHLLQYSWGV